GFLVDSFVDCATKDLLTYAKLRGKQFHIQAIGNLVPSCHLTWETAALNGTSTYTVNICFNVTGLTLTPPDGFAKKVTIGHAKVDVVVRVKTGARTEVKLEMTAPVFENAYVYAFGFPVPATVFKTKIIGEIGKVLEGALQGLVTNLP
ncbi:hypothetical protein TSMEX_002755, partial [Taenia solium]